MTRERPRWREVRLTVHMSAIGGSAVATLTYRTANGVKVWDRRAGTVVMPGLSASEFMDDEIDALRRALDALSQRR